MKLNRKGFAITAILYGLLILFVFLIGSYLLVLSARKNRVDSLIESVEKQYASKYTVDIYLASYNDSNLNTSAFVILDNGQMKDSSNGTPLGYHATFTVTKGSSIELFEIDPEEDGQGWFLADASKGHFPVHCGNGNTFDTLKKSDSLDLTENDMSYTINGYTNNGCNGGNDIISRFSINNINKSTTCYILFYNQQDYNCQGG